MIYSNIEKKPLYQGFREGSLNGNMKIIELGGRKKAGIVKVIPSKFYIKKGFNKILTIKMSNNKKPKIEKEEQNNVMFFLLSSKGYYQNNNRGYIQVNSSAKKDIEILEVGYGNHKTHEKPYWQEMLIEITGSAIFKIKKAGHETFDIILIDEKYNIKELKNQKKVEFGNLLPDDTWIDLQKKE